MERARSTGKKTTAARCILNLRLDKSIKSACHPAVAKHGSTIMIHRKKAICDKKLDSTNTSDDASEGHNVDFGGNLKM
jgi:hypothetical protein